MKVYFLFKHSDIRSPEQIEKLISEHDPIPKVPKNAVILVRQDHSHRQEFTAFIYDKNAKVHFVGHDFFVFFSSTEGQFREEFVSAASVGPFVSFARHEEVYLDLYNQLEEKTWAFLNSIRDYHYLRTYKAEVNPLKNIRDSKVLHDIKMTKSFRYMEHRGFEEFMFKFRYHREFSKMSSVDLSMKLRSVPTPVHVHFDFAKSGIVSSRIAAVIGKNGVGKSRCLKEVKNKLVDGTSYRKVIAVNLYRTVNSPRSPHYASLNVDPRMPISFASTISRIVEKRRRFDYFDSMKILKDVLRTQMNCADVKVRDLNNRWISVWEHYPHERILTTNEAKFYKENGEEFILSQGQVCLLSAISLLLLYIEKNSIILFDEPELYLHPNYIVKLVSLLESILSETDSVAMLATHSIFLVRELPKTSVYALTADEAGVRMVSPNTETLGANLDRLAYEFFSDEDVEKKYEDFVFETRKKLKGKTSKKRTETIRQLPAELASRVLSND